MPASRSFRTPLTLAALICLLSACKDSVPPELSAPAKLLQVSGDNQSVVNGPAQASAPLVVKVLDPKDRPVKDVTVSWAASDPTARLSATSTTTDSVGEARVTWTLGESGDIQTVKATASQVNGAAVVFQGRNSVLSIGGGVTVGRENTRVLSVAPMPDLRISSSVRSSAVRSPRSSAPENRRLIVQFKPSAAGLNRAVALGPSGVSRILGVMRQTTASLATAGLIEREEASPTILTARITVAAGVELRSAMAALRADPRVASVSVDERLPMLGTYSAVALNPPARREIIRDGADRLNAPRFPNDGLILPTLWHYNMIDAPRAWATVTGNASVLVAVIDDGIRFDHPAIAANLTRDGYNFVTGGNRLDFPEPLCSGGSTLIPEPGYGPDPTAHDDLSWTGDCWSRSTIGNHGLHVAGTIGAAGNDGIGTTGINWNVRIRPVRVLDSTGSGSWFDIAQGILYAAGLPASDGRGGTVTAPSAARIINMSLGGGGSVVLQSAVAAAVNAGVLIVASAGNSQSNRPSYPASYPGVLSVVALGPDMQLSSYTNIGPNVSLSAPGGNFRSSGSAGVASTTWNFRTATPNYAYYQGTSMAAPHVAGVAALVLAAEPGLSGAQLRDRLQATAVPLGASGRDNRYGYGVVNAYNAVKNLTSPSYSRFVRLYNASTGDTVRTVRVDANGTYSIPRIAEGSYFLAAGEDDLGDSQIGLPGRRFGWYGGAAGPAAVTVSAAQTPKASVSLQIGMPRESKPNSTAAQANVLLLNSYVVGQINGTHPEAYFSVLVPRAGVYTFEATGLMGTCRYGIELDPVLTLTQADGSVVAENSNTPLLGSAFCSQISTSLTPGQYFVRVQGENSSIGQFALSVRG